MALTEPNGTVHLGESSRIVHWQGLGETIALAAAEEGAAALIICGRSEENGRKVRSRGSCCCVPSGPAVLRGPSLSWRAFRV
jgi:NAD(P)-dependent dehydrogenase (short-subunit alcohol dehydrogenase family)